MIGPKVIITCCVGSYGTNNYKDQNLRALDNVFHRLDGKAAPKYPDGLVTAVNQAMRERKTEIETDYFRCRWYRNGNLHMEFKRLDLLNSLTSTAAITSTCQARKGRCFRSSLMIHTLVSWPEKLSLDGRGSVCYTSIY